MRSPERIACCVPGCSHTARRDRYPDAGEFLCCEHWRMTPRTWRKRHRLICNRGRKYGWDAKLATLEIRLWVRIKSAAIETAMGIRGCCQR